MRIEGVILPRGEESRVNREAWCQLVESRAELRRPQPRQALNPFTGKATLIKAAPDVAEVVVDGVVVGNVGWSVSEEDPLVNVSVEPCARPSVLEWAAELGGEFREDRLPYA